MERSSAYPSYQEWATANMQQLSSSGLPASLMPRLYDKLRHEILDAGSVFRLEPGTQAVVSRSLVCLGDSQGDGSDSDDDDAIADRRPDYFRRGALALTAINDVPADSDVWLIDHAWTFRLADARTHLEAVPGLLERVCAMLGIHPDQDDRDGDADDGNGNDDADKFDEKEHVAREEQQDRSDGGTSPSSNAGVPSLALGSVERHSVCDDAIGAGVDPLRHASGSDRGFSVSSLFQRAGVHEHVTHPSRRSKFLDSYVFNLSHPTVTVLELDDEPIDLLTPQRVEYHFPWLVSLSLWGTRIHDLADVLNALSGLDHLRALWLNDTPLAASGIEYKHPLLQQHPKLEILDSKFTLRYTDWAIGVAVLGSSVQTDAAATARALSQAASLDLSDRDMPILRADVMQTMLQLEQLDLRGNPAIWSQRASLRQLLAALPSLRILHAEPEHEALLRDVLPPGSPVVVNPDPVLLVRRRLTQRVLDAVWPYLQMYRMWTPEDLAAIDERAAPEPTWYLMDEVGTHIWHADSPCMRVVPFVDAARGIAFSVMWPVRNLAAGEIATRDCAAGATSLVQRYARLAPWMPHLLDERASPDTADDLLTLFEDMRDSSQIRLAKAALARSEELRVRRMAAQAAAERRHRYMARREAARRRGETPEQRAQRETALVQRRGNRKARQAERAARLARRLPVPRLAALATASPDALVRVWTDVPSLLASLQSAPQHPRFRLVADPADADVIWDIDHADSDAPPKHQSANPSAVRNEFPCDDLLIRKDKLPEVIYSVYGDVAWLAQTFDLSTQLPAFVGEYLARQAASEDNHWMIKPSNLARSLECVVTSSLAAVARLCDTGARVACKYIEQPCLVQARKFDVRFIVAVRSFSPLVAYVYDMYWVRVAGKRFSMAPHTLDDYDKHFTVMNYRPGQQQGSAEVQKRWNMQEFEAAFQAEHRRLATWSDLIGDMHGIIHRTLGAAAIRSSRPVAPAGFVPAMNEVVRPCAPGLPDDAEPAAEAPMSPRSLASAPSQDTCRAVYGVDFMLSASYQPVLLEFSYMPDCDQAVRDRPNFWFDVLSALCDATPSPAMLPLHG